MVGRHYEFLKAPFGLCNSPAIFQRFINMTFHDAQQQGLVRLYLDDVVIPARDAQMAMEKLEQTLKIAAQNGLNINFNKCKFLRKTLQFLGFIIENGTMKPSEEKTKAIAKFPMPKTIKDVQSFLGLTGFFRKFIAEYDTIARPMTQLLKKDAKFIFGNEQQIAFKTLKEKMSSDPVLRLYNPKAVTELHTDATALGFGGCLLQKQADDGLMHPVYFLSFKTTTAESKLHSYELEVLAIMICLERLRTYLLGIRFTIFTDCQAFQLTMSKKNATAKIARWALALEEYDVEVKHRSGSSMKHVDALSRNFVMTIEDGLLSLIKNAQKDDDECKLITALLEKGPHKEYVMSSDVIYKFKDGHYLLKIPKLMAIDKHEVPLHTYHIDHVGPIPSTKKGYNHILVVVDAFTKFNWLYPVKTTKCDEAIAKLTAQQEVFGNPRRIVADKGSAFKADEFSLFCGNNDIHLHLITTATPRGNG